MALMTRGDRRREAIAEFHTMRSRAGMTADGWTNKSLSFVEYWRLKNGPDHEARTAHQQKNSFKRSVK